MEQTRLKDERDKFEEKIGIQFTEGKRTLTAFLTNFKTKSFKDKHRDNEERMAVLCYWQSEEGQTLKYYLPFNPYFYVGFEEGFEKEVQSYLQSKCDKIESIEIVSKIDLEEMNHLSGKQKEYMKLSFRTIKDLNNAKLPLKSLMDRRKKKHQDDENFLNYGIRRGKQYNDIHDLITSIREYDVPYHSRVCIDTGLRAGKWFDLQVEDKMILQLTASKVKKPMPDLKILSYDIETAKDPLKFPDAQKDQIMMISMMYEGEAFLIINCSFCGNQVLQFDYQPKPQFACHVTVFNEATEKDLLIRFGQFMTSYRPSIVTTYNGDRFDYPYVMKRCEINSLSFTGLFGVADLGGQFYGNFIAHLDCYYWVDRDAFLPQGSRGLKAVAKAKLNYQPIEVDPEEMVYLAKYDTQRLAEYSVSDAVATFFLYMKHIHGFIYALSTIVPMFPDEVLRKGSGTLCQNLLMAEAFNRNIIFPNKKMEVFQKFHQGNLLDSETYTGGKVECLRTGVYRADFPTEFKLQPTAFQNLIDNAEEIIKFAIEHEMAEQSFDNIVNMDEIKNEIHQKLQILKSVKNPSKHEALPLIYHIDVAAMYPNIILTNRLQPVSIVNDKVCSGCLFNDAENNCKRQLQWEWKGQVFPLNEGQYQQIKEKLAQKTTQTEGSSEWEKLIRQEIKAYCQKIYKKTHIYTSQIKTDVVCMRENSFYVDTVRAFRDRRYEYKHLAKLQQGNVDRYVKEKDIFKAKQAKQLLALYESMQLAHKIILNSYYGYVMRKGARWYSMEMAAMVTFVGSNIISDSKDFIEGRIGKPLQLDTDGIWMLLPKGFPEDIKIRFKSGKTFKMSYPCHILNHVIYEKYANPQYQTLVNADNFEFQRKKQMTIFFEIDGPYKAMMIPAAKEKQKTTQLDIQQHNTQLLKKRYVVFNFNNKIKEFKGFEMKRRGQLRITKVFQEEIFPQYLKGSTLKECYAHCAEIAKKYISIIQKQGQGMDVHQILDFLQESRVLSKDVKEYGESKGVAINSAKRLAQFLGPDVIKGKGGLCCYFVISAYPLNRPVTERAIPTQIFDADMQTQRQFLLRWTRNDALKKGDVDIKNVLDWSYYFQRLSTQIQKMVCIPAVLQNIPNPVPEIELPEWLKKKTFDMRHHKQSKLFDFNLASRTPGKATPMDNKQQSNSKSFVNQTAMMKPIEEQRKPLLGRKKENPFSMTNNFSKWLVEQKRIWREHKRPAVDDVNPRSNQLKSILQIVSDKTAGNFTVWYHSGGRIDSFMLTVKRRYSCKGKGNKKAPRDEGEAIEIVVEESQYRKVENMFTAMIGRSFYEVNLPLLQSLIMRKGNIWKVNKQAMSYNQSQIQQVFGEYLPQMEKNFMPFIYLVHQSIPELKGRVVWALINPKGHEYWFAFVDKAKGIEATDLIKLIRQTIKAKHGDNQDKIKIDHFNTDEEAAKAVNKQLQSYHKHIKQHFLVVLQSDINAEALRKLGVKELQMDCPVLNLPKLKIEKVDTLVWKKKSLSAILQFDITSEVFKLVEWSRYSQIPICNLSIEREMLEYITNIQLGRLLHSADMLTWWNDYNRQLQTSYESMSFTGKVSHPGLHKTYCVDIVMENLAVNTIANSDQLMIEDRETAQIMQRKNYQGKNESLDEMSKVRKSFQYLRKMVRLWIKDFQQNQSEHANELLKYLHKWISTQSNAMYDPLLSRMVNELMKKVFYLLLKRLGNLGMQVIYANFSKIIVATDKYTEQQAKNSIQYILKKCVEENQKLFKYISLTPCDELYRGLIFKDAFNFVGIFEEEKFYYRLDMERLMNQMVSKYLKLLLINFIQRLSAVKEELLIEYSQSRMRLFLNYNSLIDERMINYLRGDYTQLVVEIIRKLLHDWENNRNRMKNRMYDTDVDEVDEDDEEEEQEEEDDSFIDDASIDEESQRKKKKQLQKEEKINIEFGDQHHQLQILVQSLFGFLCHEEAYKEELINIRRLALRQLKLEPSIEYGTIKPIYPTFELPCSNCFMVNQNAGSCQHCGEELNCIRQLENSIWKMMQEQGRDIYCDRCNKIKQDYLKKCGCGGRWIFKQFPLKWMPYLNRDGKQWQFVNEVFDFMSIA